jgi:hypothetical protein
MTPTAGPAIAADDLTKRVLAGMLVENTGAHMLDSGGAYGRNHERNRAAAGDDPVAWAEARPAVSWDADGVMLDLYHFLGDRLCYAEHADRVFHRWAEQWPDESWPEILDRFREVLRVPLEDVVGENTYNGADALSQVIQWWAFPVRRALGLMGDPYRGTHEVDDGDTLVVVQVHGGCDVRGGYTSPRLFTPRDGDEYVLADNAYLWGRCLRPEPPAHDQPYGDAQGVLDGVPPYDPAAHVSEVHKYVSEDAGCTWALGGAWDWRGDNGCLEHGRHPNKPWRDCSACRGTIYGWHRFIALDDDGDPDRDVPPTCPVCRAPMMFNA